MSNQLPSGETRPEPRAVTLDTAEFERFESWLEAELLTLVDAWSHLAAPGAERKAERIYLQKTRSPK